MDWKSDIKLASQKLSSLLAILHKSISTEYVKKYWGWAALIPIIILSTVIRLSNLDLLKGKYFIGPDPYIFYKYAKYIFENGSMMAIDTMRNAPIGFTEFGGAYTFFPSVMAWMYHVIQLFGLSMREWMIMYPALITIPSIIFFYLFVKELFDAKTGVLASLFLVIIPPLIHRTTAGLSDHEALALPFMFAAFYFFAKARNLILKHNPQDTLLNYLTHTKPIFKFNMQRHSYLIYAVISGIFTTLMMWTWGGWRFVAMPIGLLGLSMLMFSNPIKQQMWLLLAWTAGLNITSLIFRHTLVTSEAALLVLLAFCSYLIYFYVLPRFKKLEIAQKLPKTFKSLPKGIISIAVSAVLGLISLEIFRPGQISRIIAEAINPHRTGRIAQTVAENMQPFFIGGNGWWQNFGWFIVLALVGSVLLIWAAYKSKKSAGIISIAYIITTFVVIFSKWSDKTASSFLAKTYIYWVLAFILFLVGYFTYTYYKDKKSFEEFKQTAWQPLFVLIWFFFSLLMARGAIRIMFALAPAVALVAAYSLIRGFNTLAPKSNKNLVWNGLVAGAIIVILYSVLDKFGAFEGLKTGQVSGVQFVFFLVFLVLAWLLEKFNTLSSREGSRLKSLGLILVTLFTIMVIINGTADAYDIAKQMGPDLSGQWDNAMVWTKNNTPEDSIFIHWWDYGYALQVEGERATVTDGGHVSGAQDYFVGRNFLTETDLKTTMSYLKSRDVDYALISGEEIGKYPAYSIIGSSDEKGDRLSNIGVFSNSNSKELRNGVEYIYQGFWQFDEDKVMGTTVLPRGSAVIAGISVKANETGELIEPPLAYIITTAGQQYSAHISCVVTPGQRQLFDIQGPHLDGCVQLVPYIDSSGQVTQNGAMFYLSERVKDTMFARLYLYGEQVPGFEQVYIDKVPLGLYGGMAIGPIKVWKVTYPAGTETDDFYKTATWDDISQGKWKT